MHDDPARLRYLLDAYKDTLPGLPGFRSLSIFGSIPEGRSDGYSDIDLIVETDDLPAAKEQVLGLLESIGPIEFCWAINLRPDEWNPMIVFRDEGYFHRLDLGLTDVSAENRTIPREQTVLLEDEPRACYQHPGESGAYVPEHGSIGHFLLGQFIGGVRYVKARKRGQPMTCYRFAAACVDWQLALMYARLKCDPGHRSKLSTPDYVEFDHLLSEDQRSSLLHSLDFSSLRAMDAVVTDSMDSMLRDALELAAMSSEAFPSAVFERMMRFVSEELA